VLTETNFCILVEESDFTVVGHRKKLDSGYLVPSQSYHSILDCVVTTNERWFITQYPGDGKFKHWVGTSLVPAIESFKVVTFAGESMSTVCWDYKGVLVADFV
jgi:hypothetical protein